MIIHSFSWVQGGMPHDQDACTVRKTSWMPQDNISKFKIKKINVLTNLKNATTKHDSNNIGGGDGFFLAETVLIGCGNSDVLIRTKN